MGCEDQAFVSTDVCVKWGCDKAKLELRNKFWTCPVCGSSYGSDAKLDLISYYYVNRFGIEVDVRVASDSSGQYEMIDVIIDGDSVRDNTAVKDAVGDDRMLVGDLVVEITDKDVEISTLKERNKKLQGQYDSMFKTMVKASEKIAALKEANAWLRSQRKQDMP